jgi:hypothetical protein
MSLFHLTLTLGGQAQDNGDDGKSSITTTMEKAH